jgi:hypothetical protein
MPFWSTQSGKNPFTAKNKNGIAFLISWLFALILWLLTSLNAERTMEVSLRLSFEHVPHQVRIKGPIEPITLSVKGQGLELFRFLRRSKRQTFKVDYESVRDGRWTPQLTELNRSLGFNENIRLLTFEPEYISIDSKSLYFKKLPIRVDNQMSYSQGYDSISPARLSRDSVILYAAQPIPASVKYIATEPIKLKKITKTVNTTLRLRTPSLPDAKLAFNQIEYRLEVDQIIANEIEISIQQLGFPANTLLIPATLKVRYLVAARDFQDVQHNDFKASVTWSPTHNQSFLVPELRVLNSLVLDTEIFPKTIDYLQP